MLAVDSSARAEVDELDGVSLYQYILRFDVSMEYPVLVHVVNRFNKLEHPALDHLFLNIAPPPLYHFVHVHVHELKNQGKPPSRLIVQDFE